MLASGVFETFSKITWVLKFRLSPHDQPMMIYQFLYDQMGKKALFDNCFDIPLEIVSEDADLIRKFFGGESTLGIDQEDMEDE